jgi:hypothetical protein
MTNKAQAYTETTKVTMLLQHQLTSIKEVFTLDDMESIYQRASYCKVLTGLIADGWVRIPDNLLDELWDRCERDGQIEALRFANETLADLEANRMAGSTYMGTLRK